MRVVFYIIRYRPMALVVAITTTTSALWSMGPNGAGQPSRRVAVVIRNTVNVGKDTLRRYSHADATRATYYGFN